jgi:hypothetical protein
MVAETAVLPSRRNRFAALIEEQINASEKTQIDLARELGYENPNIITMFKKGTTRVPLDKVAPLARALDLDSGELLRQWFATFYPDALPEIEKHLGPVLTRAEKTWVWGLRRRLGAVPAFDERWGELIETIVDEA